MALFWNKKCTIHGDGNAYSRHYIHAYDIAEAIHFIVKYGYKETIFQIYIIFLQMMSIQIWKFLNRF